MYRNELTSKLINVIIHIINIGNTAALFKIQSNFC